MKVRKKPVIVDAWPITNEWFDKPPIHEGIEYDRDNRVILIHTLEGVMKAHVGDWLIRGVANEYYSCKNDIFLRTYEAVANDA